MGLSILTWPSTLWRCHRFGATHLCSLAGCRSVSPHEDLEPSADCSGSCKPFIFTTAVNWLSNLRGRFFEFQHMLNIYYYEYYLFLRLLFFTRRKQPVETRGAPCLRVTGVWPGNTFVFGTNSWGDSIYMTDWLFLCQRISEVKMKMKLIIKMYHARTIGVTLLHGILFD